MDELLPTTALLSTFERRSIWTGYTNCSLKWITAICVFLVMVFVAVIVATSVNSTGQGKPKMAGKNQTTQLSVTKRLSDILPKSFYAEFENYRLHHKKWIKDEHIKYHIEWDIENQHVGYLKTVSHSSEFISQNPLITQNLTLDGSFGIYTNITVVNDEAIETVSINGKSVTSCHKDMQADGLFYIMQLALEATFYKSEKFERIWKYQNCNIEVDFYERNSQLVSIVQGELMIKTVKWGTKRSRRRHIELAKLNHTCHIRHLNFRKCAGGYPNRLKDNRYVTMDNTEKQKDCLFIHGVGTNHRGRYEVLNSFPAYWGHIERKTKRCRSHKFIVMNTVNFGWDDQILHDNFCNFASKKNGSIDNAVLFSHSMGNLIVAAALFRGVCRLNTKSSEWYTIQAPWTGSKAADTLYKICSGHFEIDNTQLPAGILIHLLASKFCTISGKPTRGFDSLKTTYTSPLGINFDDLIHTAKQYSNGSMCGISATGMWKNFFWSTTLDAIQLITDLEKPNDGVVPFDGCSRIGGDFSSNYHDKFYKVRANHFEGTCRFGDSDWEIPGLDNEQNKPCSWYQHRLL